MGQACYFVMRRQIKITLIKILLASFEIPCRLILLLKSKTDFLFQFMK